MEFIRSIFSSISESIYNEKTVDSDDDSIPPMRDIESNDSFVYNIEADSPDTTYQLEYWRNTLSTGKEVTLLITTIFSRGIFEIDLTDSEKDYILSKDTIVLSDYNCSCQKLWNGSQQCHDIENKYMYTKNELVEINKLLHWDDIIMEETNCYDYIYDSELMYNFGLDLFEANGWKLMETVYGFDTGCVITPIE